VINKSEGIDYGKTDTIMERKTQRNDGWVTDGLTEGMTE
jgi:hypothetical protein